MDDFSYDIITFPDFDKLKNEVEKLRTELSMIVLERDNLKFVICRNIETEYMLELGGTEYKVYEAQCTALRLKRKTELIQAKKNRQERIIISDIEKALDDEFAEYRKKLDEQIDKMNEALERSKMEKLPEEDFKELKKLYRAIVKKLHPDANPDVSEQQLRLLDNAVSAYKNGDLAALRVISDMAGGIPEFRDDKSAITKLSGTKERLISSIKAIREDIQKIKSEYPYTMKVILDDKEKLNQKKKELEETLGQYQEMTETYRARIEEMLRQG